MKKTILIALASIALISMIYQFQLKTKTNNKQIDQREQRKQSNNSNWLPNTHGEIVHHSFYSLSYIEKFEQAEWVAYELNTNNQKGQYFKRNDNFRPDPDVRTGSATPNDYKGSGFDRGHLCPAGDMNFNEQAMDETFYMSNMSPQERHLNHGIWRELEENNRVWLKKNEQLFVVTGPILTNIKRTIGRQNKVGVPEMYYKVIVNKNAKKGIAWMIPNQMCTETLDQFACTIDEVEKATDLNFFPDLDPETEKQIESQFNVQYWPWDRSKYQQRLNKWNVE
ncbi:MAG: DNA/RNA non-specific endonuclease [Saprospiraceae bacterium]